MLGYGGFYRPRSRFGHWLDQQGILQSQLVEKSGVSRGTISRICNDDSYSTKNVTIIKIQKALKEMGHELPPDDYFFGL